MAAFVPAGVGGGVDGAVDEEGGDCPPGAPGDEGEVGADAEEQEPEAEVPESGPVAALHDFAHLPAGEPGFPPLLFEAALDAVAIEFDGVAVAAGEAVVSANRLHAHGCFPIENRPIGELKHILRC